MLYNRISVKITLLIISMVGLTIGGILFSLFNLIGIDLPEGSSDMKEKLIIFSFILFAVISTLSVVFSNRLIHPLLIIKENLILIEKGILPQSIKINSNDEFGEMTNRLNNHIHSLKHTARFANSIGEGNFDDNFKPLSEEDTLGHALINMHSSLKLGDKKEKERAWIMNSVAEVGEIVRSHSDISGLSDEITKYLVAKINAIQGAFYVINEDENSEKIIEMQNSFAYNRKKYLKSSFKFGEGLVGQSAIESCTIFRTEIPQDYCTISSGILGDQKPRSIIIIPLINEEKVYGLVEFASLHIFQNNEIKLVEEVSSIIARTIFNIRVNESTQKHLKQSQEMSLELREQQEELRENAEKMQATQEELKHINHKLEDQIEEVNRTQKRMQLLLENASEVITIYEEDGKIRYISPSVKHILGYQPNELIGGNGNVYIHEEDYNLSQEMFSMLMQEPDKPASVQYRFQSKEGNWIWLEASGKNLLSDPAVNGIIINSRDITLKRKAEMEERMRKNMQALSENSPDLITRLSSEGDIAYTNPTIETYTGYLPDQFLNKSLNTIEIESEIIDAWSHILNDVKTQNSKLSLEINYKSPIGDRIMQVNAIPEFNENVMESVLIVSHDITDRKLIELEIQAKNKSINESINYSKRIQNAILPDNKLIQKALPESFILYKPRDVVSGDFPWFEQKGDNIFIAAVDCTGHGVPGAMLSLVGYFQLNNIVDSHENYDSGKILDLLDHRVNSTLIRDTNGENIKDGMDIGFCKINLKSKTLEYAGAHRPLYLLRNGEINELKGDKWAIGGGVYKNQTSFTNHKIDIQNGDSVFFFSDGFPDQFGGTQLRKFGTARIKEIILNNQKMKMKKISEVFSNEFEDWKGAGKQTDDVLMIGIKF